MPHSAKSLNHLVFISICAWDKHFECMNFFHSLSCIIHFYCIQKIIHIWFYFVDSLQIETLVIRHHSPVWQSLPVHPSIQFWPGHSPVMSSQASRQLSYTPSTHQSDSHSPSIPPYSSDRDTLQWRHHRHLGSYTAFHKLLRNTHRGSLGNVLITLMYINNLACFLSWPTLPFLTIND